jgi:aldehyde:ferredoxin oxidoreductase
MTEAGGYVGRFLFIDLSHGELADEIPDEALLRAFIGGYGVGARILYERMPLGADPLGPDNVLGLVTGPLTGTPSLHAGRYCVVGKSPLTGTWGDANSGGRFGPVLKFAGYDAVFVRGISKEPVYLLIEEGRAELQPANDLWGLDCLETEEALQSRHGRGTEVACVGPAGERLARISCIITDGGRAAGRSGLGAVMGSKRLKAVAVRGKLKPKVSRPEDVKLLRRKYLPEARSGAGEVLHEYGTAGFTEALITAGRTPIKNWRGSHPSDFPDAEALDGPAFSGFVKRRYGCWGCSIGCGAIVQWESDGELLEGHRPEYETLAALGTYCCIDDVAAIMTMNEICNRAGLDTISAGATISFAMECYENGLVGEDELDGMSLGWGDGEAATALLRSIVNRRGLGDLLADGVLRASQQLGRGSEAFAVHAGGQELPAHDPRHWNEAGLQYQVSPTPGRHTQGGGEWNEISAEALASLGADPDLKEKDPVRYKGQAYAAHLAWWNTLQAAGLCYFASMAVDPKYVAEFVSAVTGWDFDMAECAKTGERIEVMRHLFNLREGHNPLHVRVAERALGHPPLEAGPTAGVTVEVEDLRREYLRVMSWDPETAMPSVERLESLGLADFAKELTG